MPLCPPTNVKCYRRKSRCWQEWVLILRRPEAHRWVCEDVTLILQCGFYCCARSQVSQRGAILFCSSLPSFNPHRGYTWHGFVVSGGQRVGVEAADTDYSYHPFYNNSQAGEGVKTLVIGAVICVCSAVSFAYAIVCMILYRYLDNDVGT